MRRDAAADLRRPIIVASGGTGGHMFPAIAVAEALERKGAAVAMMTDARGARWLADRPHLVIAAGSPSGPWREAARGAFALARGTAQSLGRFRAMAPAAAALFGGYACVPTALAAMLKGTPYLVHEQNAVFGKANRLVARRAGAVALSFAGTASLPAEGARPPLLTGNPVRPGFDAGAALRPREDGRFRLLVLGGSQGAQIFSALVPAALGLLRPDLRRRLVVAQQCRAEDLAAARAAYSGLEATIELEPFFQDVPRRMADADLLLCRSGASTIAELLALGKPAILIPYPHAAEDHQHANARAVERAGAGLCLPQIEATPDRLAALLAQLAGDIPRLRTMAASAAALARPDAAERLADHVLTLAFGTQP